MRKKGFRAHEKTILDGNVTHDNSFKVAGIWAMVSLYFPNILWYVHNFKRKTEGEMNA